MSLTIEYRLCADVIGVCKSVSDVQTIIARSSNRELQKREVVLVDQTNTCVSISM